jgi:DHA3 family tetracycline resistance protein-like MFS transporter
MKKMDAYKVHLIQSALNSLAGSTVWTGMIVYQVLALKLTPLELVSVGTVMEATIFLFEIPTGIVADVYSRRLSVIIGFFLMGIAYIVEASSQLYAVLLIGNVIWSIGYTFTSGAYDAWMVDELGQGRAGNAFLRSSQVERIAGRVGTVLSVILGSIDLRLPIIIGGMLVIFTALFLLLFMPENGFAPTPSQERNSWQRMGDTFRQGFKVIRSRPMLLSILGIGIFIGLYSEGWDRLWQAHLLQTFNLASVTLLTPLLWIAILNTLASLVGLGMTEIVRRRVDTNNPASLTRAVFWLIAAMVGAIIVYGLAPHIGVALAVFFVFVVARSLVGPLFMTWSNQHIDANVRATVLSVQSQTDAIGQIVGGPPIGVIGQLSLRAAFIASGVILSPALFLLQRVRRLDTTPGQIATVVAEDIA